MKTKAKGCRFMGNLFFKKGLILFYLEHHCFKYKLLSVILLLYHVVFLDLSRDTFAWEKSKFLLPQDRHPIDQIPLGIE